VRACIRSLCLSAAANISNQKNVPLSSIFLYHFFILFLNVRTSVVRLHV